MEEKSNFLEVRTSTVSSTEYCRSRARRNGGGSYTGDSLEVLLQEISEGDVKKQQFKTIRQPFEMEGGDKGLGGGTPEWEGPDSRHDHQATLSLSLSLDRVKHPNDLANVVVQSWLKNGRRML